ncbi:hypothetical protein HNQ94_003333 [Salirhabdus euzebyi]|uniref:Uncharacterized protein n=1 Tax=Salirhabdus euzebyi TaxID=394506 RepID=A0A841Q964_9BACI|nr:hypothetical protein [Salirhabdus euzebyi]MBB6454844.1 hypothetical protein [Salirhabdus euzebyi]
MQFNNLKDWFIETGKLSPLGITDSHLHFFFGLISIFFIYYVFSPLIRWLVELQWSKVLTYMLGSMMALFLWTFVEFYQGANGTGNMEFSDLASSVLAIIVFGVSLFIIHLVQSFVRHIREKNKKNMQPQKNV